MKIIKYLLSKKVILFLCILNIIIAIQYFRGKNNIINFIKFKTILWQKNQQLNEITQKREIISKNIQLLQGPNADQDYIDQVARESMNLVKENEHVVSE